jgi:rRNA maturation endonuclease Nob1
MICPKCQFENREDANFCLECGERFEIQCTQCGKVLPAGAKFCDGCGHDLRIPQKTAPIDYANPQREKTFEALRDLLIAESQNKPIGR